MATMKDPEFLAEFLDERRVGSPEGRAQAACFDGSFQGGDGFGKIAVHVATSWGAPGGPDGRKARDFRRISKFFLTSKPVSLPVITAPVIERKWLRASKHVVKYGLIAYTLVWATVEISAIPSREEMPKPEWYGLYEINEVTHFNDQVAGPHPHVFPWKQVVFGRSNKTYVRMMNDSVGKYTLQIFTPDTTMTFTPDDVKSKDNAHVFRYNFSDSANIRLTGMLQGDSVEFVLHRLAKNESNFRLDSTQFHWISDKPNNK
jgi:hypothetical protein